MIDIKNISLSLVVFILVLSGCTLDEVGNSNQQTVTKEDLQAAAQILGETLSSDNSGVVLSVEDALMIIAQSSSGNKIKHKENQKVRGATIQVFNDNNEHSYNPDTGTHTFIFQRDVSNALFRKFENDTLTYIYRDQNNDFIQFPREQQEKIVSLYYTGIHEGQLSSLDRESFFARKDTFLFTGFSGNSDALRIEGTHTSQGMTEIYRYQDESIERSSELKINFLNIQIARAALGDNPDFGQAIAGTLSWQLLLKATDNKPSARLAGTVRLNGDGTGLMKFRNNQQKYILNLENGKVRDLNNEFEGQVVTVNSSGKSLSLAGGFSVYINNQTSFENGNYASLSAVKDSLATGIKMYAAGKGTVNNKRFIVSEITFRQVRTASPNQEQPLRFNNVVTAANDSVQTFTLAEKAIVQINPDVTAIDENGDYNSLQAVAKALKEGKRITAHGESTLSSAFKDRITAKTVKFDNE